MKDVSKDYVKDFFKDCLKDVIPTKPDSLKAAAAKGLKEFLTAFRVQLESAGVDEDHLSNYIPPLKLFLRDKTVAATLGLAFEPTRTSLGSASLAGAWQHLGVALPSDFNWDRLVQRYLDKIVVLRQQDKELREILNSVTFHRTAVATEEAVGIPKGFDLAKHRDALLDRFSRLKLDSFDTSGAAYTDLKLWSVFVSPNVRESADYIPQLYELPKDHQFRLSTSRDWKVTGTADSELRRRRQLFLAQPSRPVLEVVKDPTLPRIVILGDPGAGKSTLVQYVALQWAQRPISELPIHPFPLLIELREYARLRATGEVEDLLDFCHDAPGQSCHFDRLELHRRMQGGEALILLDGLDEVFEPVRRREVVGDIHRLVKDYPLCRLIVTSRVVGYEPQMLRGAEFRHIVLQDFEPTQIETFLDLWHQETFKDKFDGVAKRERLKRSIRSSSALRELAQNPLLLTLMAILNRHQELPRDRAELYRQASRILLHQWDIERALSDGQISGVTLDSKDKQRLLRRLAYEMQASQTGLAGNLISTSTLESKLLSELNDLGISQAREVAKALIKQLRDRNFILCSAGTDSYAFIHRTFLEFFCADNYIFRFKDQQSITLTELIEQVFAVHWREEAWHEVLCLITGMVEPGHGVTFVEFLLNRMDRQQPGLNVVVAARCFRELRNPPRSSSITRQLQEALKSVIAFQFPFAYEDPLDEDRRRLAKNKGEAVTLLGMLWPNEPDVIRWLKKCIEENNEGVSWQAMLALIAQETNRDEIRGYFIALAQDDANRGARATAVGALGKGWKNDEDVLRVVCGVLQRDEYLIARMIAASAIVEGWNEVDSSEALLIKRLKEETETSPRTQIIRVLARGWPASSMVLRVLTDLLQKDQNFQIRRSAGEALLSHWKSDQAVVDLVIAKATNDPGGMTRGDLLESLGKEGIVSPGLRELLMQKAETDLDSSARKGAINGLKFAYRADTEVVDLFRRVARNDQDQFVRWDAWEAVISVTSDDAESQRLLRQFIATDAEEYSRGYAVRALRRFDPPDPETLHLLQNIAQSDSSAKVRVDAIRALGSLWKQEPEFTSILNKLAQDRVEEVRKETERQLARLRYFREA